MGLTWNSFKNDRESDKSSTGIQTVRKIDTPSEVGTFHICNTVPLPSVWADITRLLINHPCGTAYIWFSGDFPGAVPVQTHVQNIVCSLSINCCSCEKHTRNLLILAGLGTTYCIVLHNLKQHNFFRCAVPSYVILFFNKSEAKRQKKRRRMLVILNTPSHEIVISSFFSLLSVMVWSVEMFNTMPRRTRKT